MTQSYAMNNSVPLNPHPPIARLSQLRLRRALAKTHEAYPDEADFLSRVGKLLEERLEEIILKPKNILDLGDKSGVMASLLRKRYPKARVYSLMPEQTLAQHLHPPRGLLRRSRPVVVSEMSQLPFKRNQFDLVISNMALHWSADLPSSLREIRRIMRREGLFLCTLAGEETLRELRDCLNDLDRHRYGKAWPRVLKMPELHQFGDMLSSSGFGLPVVDRDLIHPTLPAPSEIWRRLRVLGAGNHHQTRFPGLTGKGYLSDLDKLYRKRYSHENGQVTFTIDLIFGHAWKTSANANKKPNCALPMP
ncbi:MAG: methyltransferase domain-containing protein [Magnetococcales bacterium]|nr:methyltransferase domain-containing protein [Magnetococcales bacterium]